MRKIKQIWCRWFHNCLWLPNKNWSMLVCPKCNAEHKYHDEELPSLSEREVSQEDMNHAVELLYKISKAKKEGEGKDKINKE